MAIAPGRPKGRTGRPLSPDEARAGFSILGAENGPEDARREDRASGVSEIFAAPRSGRGGKELNLGAYPHDTRPRHPADTRPRGLGLCGCRTAYQPAYGRHLQPRRVAGGPGDATLGPRILHRPGAGGL